MGEAENFCTVVWRRDVLAAGCLGWGKAVGRWWRVSTVGECEEDGRGCPGRRCERGTRPIISGGRELFVVR